MPWPELGSPRTRRQTNAAASLTPANPAAPVAPSPAPAPTAPEPQVALPQPLPGGVRAIPRASWAKANPIPTRLNPMGSIKRITVHHEGWTPVYFTDTASTAARLESIRQSHLQRLGAGDIGYHYVIDRQGRLWEGRNIAYQGAHVSKENENNLGIMVLGNFTQQSPSSGQLATLQTVIASMMRQYRVPVARVYTHQELGPTSCPGTSLQSAMVSIRRSGRLT